jgi:hypothetical protein
MFHYDQFWQDKFLAHFHKRSNVESTFSKIKAKFRDHVRSKPDVAMINEVLCKVICHNICCLIQETHGLGISAVFWTRNQATAWPDAWPSPRCWQPVRVPKCGEKGCLKYISSESPNDLDGWKRVRRRDTTQPRIELLRLIETAAFRFVGLAPLRFGPGVIVPLI